MSNLINYEAYMGGACTAHKYNSQFVSGNMIDRLRDDRVLMVRSLDSDRYLNTGFTLPEWDNIARGCVPALTMQQLNGSVSASEVVSVVKTAARLALAYYMNDRGLRE